MYQSVNSQNMAWRAIDMSLTSNGQSHSAQVSSQQQHRNVNNNRFAPTNGGK